MASLAARAAHVPRARLVDHRRRSSAASCARGHAASCSNYSTPYTYAHTSRRSFATSRAVGRALPFSLYNGPGVARDGYGAEEGEKLRMVMFGKPGAGKGTLSSRLVQKYDIVSVSTGDLLRQHIALQTDLGKQAESRVAAGELLPDELMLNVTSSKLNQIHDRNWLVDGFPRTLGQARMLDADLRDKQIPLTLVINLEVADEIILSRISDRWIHLPSGRVYNLSYNPPKVDARDDVTGEPLSKRPDDNPEVFARRLEKFYASTAPLLEYYTKRADALASSGRGHMRMVTLTGETSDEIWPQLEQVVLSFYPRVREREELKRRTSLSEAVLARRVSEANRAAVSAEGAGQERA